MMDGDRKLLVIYAGGTIGMLKDPIKGYRPAKGYLFDALQSDRRFHDPQHDSLASHSHSETAYREWRDTASSGSSTPASAAFRQSLTVQTSDGQKTLPCLISPHSSTGFGSQYVVWQYEDLIDSSQIKLDDWSRLASDIARNYALFDAFLILHGTDTMAWTASALSFMLEGLGKTVILTGAQIPVSNHRNDGIDNLLGAMTIARKYIIPEVCLFFHNKLFRGNRTIKHSNISFAAFTSPNAEPLATVGIPIEIGWEKVLAPVPNKPFQAHTRLCPDVRILQLWPGIGGSVIRCMTAEPTKGLILLTYGSGNGPDEADFIASLAEADQRGVVLVNVTQCQQGTVVESYEAARALSAAGVVSGADMTTEAAFAKLTYLLGRGDLSQSEIKRLFIRPLRGELTTAILEPQIRLSDARKRLHSLLINLGRHGELDETSELASASRLSESELALLHKSLMPILVSQLAAEADSTRLRRLLDESGSAVMELLNTQCDEVTMPLHSAIRHGRANNVQILVDAGASIHSRDSNGQSALQLARLSHDDQIIGILQAAGAR